MKGCGAVPGLMAQLFVGKPCERYYYIEIHESRRRGEDVKALD
jgi:hypothetical protein